jgi:hypothetical protein
LVRDFNRVDVEGLDLDAFENAMASFEGEISPALDRITATKSIPSEDDRISLINLICALALRNPRLRETIRHFHERVAKQMLNVMLSTPERWAAQTRKTKEEDEGFLKELPEVSYDEMKKFAQEERFKIQVPTLRHIQLEIENFDKVLPILLDRNWLMVRAPKDSGGFITSDHPVILAWSDPSMRGGFYPGLWSDWHLRIVSDIHPPRRNRRFRPQGSSYRYWGECSRGIQRRPNLLRGAAGLRP